MAARFPVSVVVACVLAGASTVTMAAWRGMAPPSTASARPAPAADCRRELGPAELADVGLVRLNPSAQVTFDEAAAFFRQRRYAAAYARFAGLADAGHVPSARIALAMLDQGRALFGSEWSASAEQQCRWHQLLLNRALRGVELIDNTRGD